MSDELVTFEFGSKASSSDVNNNFQYLNSKCANLLEQLNTLRVSTQTLVQDSLKTILGSSDKTDFKDVTGENKSLLEWLKESKEHVDEVAKTLTNSYNSKVEVLKSDVPQDNDGHTLTDEELSSTFDGTTPLYNGIYRKSTTNAITISNRTFSDKYYHYIVKKFYTAGKEQTENNSAVEPQVVFKEIYGRIPCHFLYYNGKTKLNKFVIPLPTIFTENIICMYESSIKIIATSTTGVKVELNATLTKDFENQSLIGTFTLGKNYPDFNIVFYAKGGII